MTENDETVAEKPAKKGSKEADPTADMTLAEKAAHAEGVEQAEKYKEEQENRADDDPLVLAQEAYSEAEENREPIVAATDEDDEA